MNASPHSAHSGLEFLDSRPVVQVQETEYRRLLGYPHNHVPGERVAELAAWARDWYAAHGRPWVYVREAQLQVTPEGLQLEGLEFRSPQLHQHLRQHQATRAVLILASAGRECEEHARQLWEAGKPDEYFFLEIFGSAVVERLVATLSGRICDLAEHDGLMAVPHYSPGYTGWDVVDQTKLFGLIAQGISRPFPGPIEVLSSGMLRPKKSLLGVVGLAARPRDGRAAIAGSPCMACAFSPCDYRRAPYQHSQLPPERPAPVPAVAATRAALDPAAKYSVNSRALRKWAHERVRLDNLPDGSISAHFRFDGTTCSNQGQPLAFDYSVTLSGPDADYTILRADCRPAPEDKGHALTCAYLSNGASHLQAISEEKPLLGRPLNEVLGWERVAAPAGCHCSADSRLHKWGLALEAIHFALVHAGPRANAELSPTSP